MLQTLQYETVKPEEVATWFKAARANDIPENGGVCIEYGELQIALFNFTRRGEWYACQNLCPHKHQMILSRGMIGTNGQEPKVACPFHKKTFSLKSGENFEGTECSLATYPVKEKDGFIYIGFAR